MDGLDLQEQQVPRDNENTIGWRSVQFCQQIMQLNNAMNMLDEYSLKRPRQCLSITRCVLLLQHKPQSKLQVRSEKLETIDKIEKREHIEG